MSHRGTFCFQRPVTRESANREKIFLIKKMKQAHPIQNPFHEQLINDFTDYLEQSGYRRSTLRMLPGCVKEFLWRMEGAGISIAIQEIKREHVLGHHEYLQQRPNYRRPGGLSEMMIGHHMYSLRVFFNWLLHTGRIDSHPMSKLKFRSPKSNTREVLTRKEIRTMYECCQAWKERALLALYYGCGLRCSEGIHLTTNDVKLREGLLYVRSGKGGKSRAVPMSSKVRKDLEGYLYHERFALAQVNNYMTNTRGQGMSGESMNELLKKLLQRADIDKQITLHSLRHSIATHLLASGLGVEQVRDFLGHKHIESTQVYTKVNQKQFRKWIWKNT